MAIITFVRIEDLICFKIEYLCTCSTDIEIYSQGSPIIYNIEISSKRYGWQ